MKDRIYLQHLWSFLQNEMAIVAAKIKASAQKVYDCEVKENNLHLGLHFHSASNSASGSNIFKKSPNKSNRGLIELTNDSLIFAKLHMWFTWILRASACQITEEFVHGPINEDLQIKIEQITPSEFTDKIEIDMFDQIDNDVDFKDSSLFKFDTYGDLLKARPDSLQLGDRRSTLAPQSKGSRVRSIPYVGLQCSGRKPGHCQV